ncbi:MAG: ABC transporter permease, partial [Coriobacteriales bacterium]|nr:ABC transporter permease [Coriobacteriales bacterium]
MSVFRTSLRMLFRRPVYLLVYIVLFGLLGLVLVDAPDNAAGDVTYQQASRPIAVIDRDGSAISQGLTEHLGKQATFVDLADERFALQDAIAHNNASYILIIPAGFGDDFLASVRAGETPVQLESAYSIEVATGLMMDTEVASYMNALRISAIADPIATNADLAHQAQQVAETDTQYEVVQNSGQIMAGSIFPFFFQWSSYPITLGIMVLVAGLYANFHTGELRRRNLAAPIRTMSVNLQIMLSCIALSIMTWLFICLLSLTPMIGGMQLWAASPLSAALIYLAALVYTSVPLTLGFLLSQFNLKEMALNGFSVTIALVMMFLSGMMMGRGTSYLDGILLVIARFIPA